MSNYSGGGTGAYTGLNQAGSAVSAAYRQNREFLPEVSLSELERIQKELHGMVGPRIILMNDDLVQIRRAVNVLMEEPDAVLADAMKKSRVVAMLSSDAAIGEHSLTGLKLGGATHLAMNLPKVLQPALDAFQNSRDANDLTYFLKCRGFKHPSSFLLTAVELGLKLVATGDQSLDQPERKAASIESIAIDVSNILDQDRAAKVILWASSHYLKRTKILKTCTSTVDYLSLNHKVFTIHSGNYLVDGGPLRKIVFDLSCPGIITSGKNRLIDNLATGIDGDNYGNWNAILLEPKPTLDSSYFLTND
jgi:hypothetical protein